MTTTMFGAVIEEGPALGYYLATHASEAKKIFAMGDTRQAERTLFRIAVKLETEGEETPSPKPKKPEPPETVRGTGAGNLRKDPDKMTFKEREREIHKRSPGSFNYEP